MSRGNLKQDIFLSNRDREHFLHLLDAAISKYSLKCHSYCLMTNHYHLLIETCDGGLSEGMHLINSGYSGTFNSHHHRTGHVFQGRYTSRLIKGDADFLTIVRYTALNPIKGKLTSDPALWKWSSYNAHAGATPPPRFLETDLVRSLLTSLGGDGSAEYRAFIAERIPDALAEDIHHVPTLRELFANCTDQVSKKRAMHEAHTSFGYTMIAIASFLGVNNSTVSRAIKSYQDHRF